MASEQSAKQYFSALKKAVSQFNRRWPSVVSAACLYELPAYPRHKRRHIVPPLTQPQTYEGRTAIDGCVSALKQFLRTREQNPLSVIRFPGYVAVTESVSYDIDVINELKQGLQDTLQTLEPNEPDRVQLTRRLFPGVSMLQVYRSIVCHDTPVNRLEFTWSPMTMATRKLKMAHVIALLEESLSEPPPPEFENKATWQSVVEKELQEVRNLNDDQLVQRKPIAPHPKVMVYFDEGENSSTTGKYDKIHNASLPVFIRSTEDLIVSPLKPFHHNPDRQPNIRQKSKRKFTFHTISKPLGIFKVA